jgi:hypothetical protein
MRLWKLMGKTPLAGLLVLTALVGVRAQADKDSEARMKRDITFLASDECEGRGPGTKGIDKAADYVAAQFKEAGLKPGGPSGSYFQPFTISGPGKLEAGELTLTGPLGQTIELNKAKVVSKKEKIDPKELKGKGKKEKKAPKQVGDFTVMGFSGSGTLTAPVVFAGFGITAPRIGYDDYKGLDVADKVVLVLRKAPRYGNDKTPFDSDKRDEHATFESKLANAQVHRAAAVLLVNDSTALAKGDDLSLFSETAYAPGAGAIPYLHIRRDLADAMLFSSLGKRLDDVEGAINRDLVPQSAPLPGWKATVRTEVIRKTLPVKNVIGVLEGSGDIAGETVVIGAHYDHLGYGEIGSRLKDRTKKLIHHGADDNGSGTTALMELARRFAKMKDRQGRRLVFIAFSGEERGLLGSRFYCKKQPLFALADTAAMVNLDMVGRLRTDPKTGKEKLLVEGVGTGKGFSDLVGALNKKHGFQLSEKQGGLGPSDHDSFCQQKIPVLFLWTGYHADYHMPTDTSDKINVAGMVKVADLAEQVISRLEKTDDRPEYVHVKSSASPTRGKGGPRLGVMPSYDDDDIPGMLIDNVADGGPAATAGLKAGDRIIEIAGRPVTNIGTYMTLMGQQQRGQPIEVRVLRNGKRQTFQVTPQ